MVHKKLCIWKFADQQKSQKQIRPHNVILIYALNYYRAEREKLIY